MTTTSSLGLSSNQPDDSSSEVNPTYSHDVTADIQRPICLRFMIAVRRTPETRHWAVACIDAPMADMGR